MGNKNREKLKVLIIGAGCIAALFDKPGDERVLTHAHAVWKSDGFELVGFVDPQIDKARAAAEVWGGKAFPDLVEAFGDERVDVAGIAVPDEFHYELLNEVARYPVRLVLAEKPLTRTLEEAEKVRKLYAEIGRPVLVNYSRRFVPEFEDLKIKIQSGEFGRFLNGAGYYGKGFLHNGSHMVDLMRHLLGEPTGWKVTGAVEDFYGDDPSLSVSLEFGDEVRFSMLAVDCRAYTVFELDLLFEKKRVRIVDSGFSVEEYDMVENPVFKGYRRLEKGREYGTSFGVMMSLVYENIFEHLSRGTGLKCSLEDAYRTMKLCEEVKRG
ncbi:MAG: Gfo/Idh/MocA family oxidoreductase [Firmicutes bacterium]|nr:Gfo/Idh/MocA family oxidoreductase [Bacillota bacterium]